MYTKYFVLTLFVMSNNKIFIGPYLHNNNNNNNKREQHTRKSRS